MLRPATPASLDRLLHAASGNDLELDLALVGLGVLPPADLAEIREWLSLDGIDLVAGSNADGHRVITVVTGHRPLALIHPDGRVVASLQATA